MTRPLGTNRVICKAKQSFSDNHIFTWISYRETLHHMTTNSFGLHSICEYVAELIFDLFNG